MPTPSAAPRGRGAGENPANRFTHLSLELEEPLEEKVPTVYLDDTSKSALTFNQSPDIPFDASLNPYRGCEHGCIYCYARPTHEYLGLSAGLDFETRILVKRDAAELLAKELASPRWQPQLIGLSGVTDPYQPIERKLGITRACLEVLAEFRNPVAVVTKSAMVSRDLEPLARLAAHDAVAVYLSITSLDPELSRRLEPRAPHPEQRLKALAELSSAGIPCGVLVAPVIPALTDHEIPAILAAAAAAGAKVAGFVMLRLPGAVAGLFTDWLARHFPDRLDKVLNRQREMRGGRLNDPNFGSRMKGQGVFAEQIKAMFQAGCRKHGLDRSRIQLSTAAFRRSARSPQLELFNTI